MSRTSSPAGTLARGLAVFGAVALFGPALLSGCAPPDDPDSGTETQTSSILDGTKVAPSSYPAIGRVFSARGDGFDDNGTGALIGPRHVMTAAHVIAKNFANPGGIHFRTYPATGSPKNYYAKSVRIHPSYQWSMTDPFRKQVWGQAGTPLEYDVAIIELVSDVPGVTPYSLSLDSPTVGRSVTFFGFGQVAMGGGLPAAQPDGTLYRGMNTISALDERSLITTFTKSSNGSTSSTYKGDSGGPILYNSLLVGVARSVSGYTYGSNAFFTRGRRYRDWATRALTGADDFAKDYYESVDRRSSSVGRYFTRTPVALETVKRWGEGRSFHVQNDEDSLSFVLNSTQTVTFALDRPYPADYNSPEIRLYKDGVLYPVTVEDSGSEGTEHWLTFTETLPPGTYDVAMIGVFDKLAWYTAGVSIDGWVTHADPYDPDFVTPTGTRATTLSNNGMALYRSITWQEDDWAFLDVTARQEFLVETFPLTDDPYLYDTVLEVMDLARNVKGQNDDRTDIPSGGWYSAVSVTLDPGTYLVRVRGYDGRPVHGYGLKATPR